MKEIIFDDIVSDEYGEWTQLCMPCAKTYFSNKVWDEIPTEGFICGIKNCNNEAVFYLDIKKIEIKP